jgi:GNAT superfamily N-acetyltransferase
VTALREHARRAEPADLDAVVMLAAQAREELVGQRGGVLWSVREAVEDHRAALSRSFGDATALAVVGCLDDVVVGYGLASTEVLRDGRRIAVVTDLYVEPLARGVGVGEALMDAVISWATAAGCAGVDALVLPGMRESKNFFERFGLVARAILVHRALSTEPGHGANA